MQSLTLLLLTTLTTLAAAQNPFSFNTLDTVKAGSPFNITWSPSTGTVDTVSLVLRQGDAKALNTIATIASHIPNTGSYIWTPPTSLVAGSGYAFEIIDDGNTAINNYSKDFTLDSPNTVSSVMPSTAVSTGASVATGGAMSGSTTGSGSAKTTATETGTAAGGKTTAGSGTGSGSGSATGSPSAANTAAGASGSAGAKNGGGRVVVGMGAVLGMVGMVMALL